MAADYSVIITVRNRRRLLERCLHTVLWQDYPHYEVVVVDYGSSPPVTIDHADRTRVRVIRMEPADDTWNGCIALNAGIANASAERIVLLNCDCLMAPDLLRAVDALFREGGTDQQIYWRRLDLSKAGLAVVGCVAGAAGIARLRSCLRPGFARFLVAARLASWHPPTSYGDFLAVRKQPLIDLGGFDERMAGWGQMDIDMMERLKAVGYAVHWGMELKLIHQFHPPQSSQDDTATLNIALSRAALSDGQLVRNGGPTHLQRYLTSGECLPAGATGGVM